MTKRYQPRLTIYVVWHPAYNEGRKYAEFLYSVLTRDVKNPVARGLGIPVYFRNVLTKDTGQPLHIALDNAQHSVVVVLVDNEMVADEGVWQCYLQDLWEKTKVASYPHRLYPVSLSENAFNLSDIEQIHYIRLSEKAEEQRHNVLAGSLIHELCRLLLDRERVNRAKNATQSPLPVTLFISHAHRDGKDLAEKIRDYLQANTALKSFFDAVDIAPGYAFAEEILSSLEYSAVLTVQTDAYGSSEWCRKEVIAGKRFGRPMVSVNALSRGEVRSFPYMGNIPTVRMDPDRFRTDPEAFKDDMQYMANILVQEVFRSIYLKLHFQDLADLYSWPVEPILFPRPPELMTLLLEKQNIENGKRLLIYPDPPLDEEELNLLSQFAPQLEMTTPILLGGIK